MSLIRKNQGTSVFSASSLWLGRLALGERPSSVFEVLLLGGDSGRSGPDAWVTSLVAEPAGHCDVAVGSVSRLVVNAIDQSLGIM